MHVTKASETEAREMGIGCGLYLLTAFFLYSHVFITLEKINVNHYLTSCMKINPSWIYEFNIKK